MRIATSTIYSNLVGQMQDLDSSQSTLETELSTGLSFTQPSDNPTGMATVLNLVSQSQEQAQYEANATTALQVSQAAYSGLNQLNTLSNAVDEIATEGASGTSNASQLQGYATQIDAYLQQAVQLGNSQFEGNYLYAGTAVNQAPFQTTVDASGQTTAVTYAGNTSQAAIPVSTSSSISPSTSGTTNQALATFMNQLISLRDALQNGDSAGIASAQSDLTSSSESIIAAAADSSAVQSAIQSVQSQATSMQQTLGTTISGDSGADVAVATTQLTEAQTAYQAVLESSARIMQTTLLNYLSTTVP